MHKSLYFRTIQAKVPPQLIFGNLIWFSMSTMAENVQIEDSKLEPGILRNEETMPDFKFRIS